MERAWFIALVLLCCAVPLASEVPVLGPQELLRLILDRNPDVRQAADAASYASFSLEAVRSGRLPALGLETDYDLYYQNRKQDEDYHYENSTTHSITIGFYTKQLLPTYGTLQFDLSDTLTLATLGALDGSPTDPRFAQAPAFSVTLEQPAFCNGRFIDGRIYPSALRKQELARQTALESERAVRNRALTGAFALVFDVVNLRNLIGQQEKAIEIRNQSLLRLKKSLESGIVAETDVAQMSVEIGKEKEILLQAAYQLATKEDDLRSALGMRQGSPIVFDEDLADIRWIQPPPGPRTGEEDLARNPSLRLLELNLAEKRIATILNGFAQAGSLTSRLSIAPRYPYSRTESWDQDFDTSFSAFLDPLAGIDVSFSIHLDVPFLGPRKNRPRQSADLVNEKMGEEALSVEKQRLAMQLESLSIRQDNLQETVRLLTDNLRLLERQKDIDRRLLGIGDLSELDLVEIEVEYLKKENELKKAHMNIFLVALERLTLLGRDLERELQQWVK